MATQALYDNGVAGIWPFIVASVAIILGVAVRVGARRLRGAREPRHVVAATALDAVLVLAVLAVIGATIVPTAHLQGVPARDLADSAVNLDPFRTIENILRWGSPSQKYANLVVNVLLFVPFGWAMALKARTHHPILSSVTTGTALSVLVETGQFLLPLSRSTDVDDVILNALGTALGAISAVMVLPALRWVAHGRRRSRSSTGG